MENGPINSGNVWLSFGGMWASASAREYIQCGSTLKGRAAQDKNVNPLTRGIGQYCEV